MHGSSLQQEQHIVHLSMGATSVHCGSCISAGGVSLPGSRDLTVRAKSPRMFSFEILVHCGSWGVLWGIVAPAGVMPVCRPDDCAVRGDDTHTHIYTQIHTHTSGLWIHSSAAGYCLCWI